MNIEYFARRGWEKRAYKKFMPTVFLSLFLIFTVTLLTGLTKYRQLVTITDETASGNKISVLSFLGDDVSSILRQEKINLSANDVLTFKKHGGRVDINIKRAVPIYLTIGGKPTEKLEVKAGTDLADILKMKGIVYNPSKHRLNHSLEYIPNYGDKISVDEISTMVKESSFKQTDIPFTVKEVEDKNILKGQRVIKTKGEVGKLEQFEQHEMVNGLIVKTDPVNRVVAEPKEEVVLVGVKEEVKQPKEAAKQQKVTKNKKPDVATRFVGPVQNPQPIAELDAQGWSTIKGGKATAYTYNVGSRTASGTKVGVGSIAVDPKAIPMGSEVKVYQNGKLLYEGKAQDTGGAIKNNKVDLFFNSMRECRKFGVKHGLEIKFKPPQKNNAPKSPSKGKKR